MAQTLTVESVEKSRAHHGPELPASGSSRAKWTMLLIVIPFAVLAIANLRLLLALIGLHNEAPDGYPEGANVYGFLLAFKTHHLYRSPFDFPWDAQLFGPLFLITGTILATIFHGNADLTTVSMRTVSFAACLGSAVIVGCIGFKLEHRKSWSAIAMVCALSCPWLIPFASVARPDVLAVLLALAALMAYQSSGEKLRSAWLAGALGAAAFLTKQSTAPVSLALLIDCLWMRRYKHAATLVAAGAAVVVAVMGPLMLSGQPVLANMTAMRYTDRNWPSVPGLLIAFLRLNQPGMLAIAIALLGAAFSLKNRKYCVFLLAATLAWIANVAALSNVGGNYHYLIQPWLLTMCVLPAGLKVLEKWASNAPWIPVAIFCLLSVVLLHQRNLLKLRLPPAVDASALASLKVLSDSPYLELRTREPQLFDPYIYHQFYEKRVWSDEALRQRIDAEEYDLILLGVREASDGSGLEVGHFRGTTFWGPDVLGEFALNYRVLCRVTDHVALVPLNRNTPVSKADIESIFHQPCIATSARLEIAPGNS